MRRRDQRGVTMVELLVAMVLMAVALLVLAATFPYAMYGVVASGFQTTATLLAQEAIERAEGHRLRQHRQPELRWIVGDSADRLQRQRGLPGGGGVSGFYALRSRRGRHPDQHDHNDHRGRRVRGSVPDPIWRTTVTTIRAN